MGITVKKILVRFNMEKINKFLLMVISMVAIMITAVGIDKGIQFYNNRKCRLSENSRKHGVKVWDMVSLSQQNH
ncbi:hypothetical protein D7V94_16755, partial [Parablautia intestinalis]